MVQRHPQTAYAGLQKSLQQDWSFVQRVTLDIGNAFQAVEDELRETLLPVLFQGVTSQISRRAITGVPSKQAGIALPDPNLTSGLNWTASCIITGYIVAELRGTAEFRLGDHGLLMGWIGRRSNGNM